MMMWWAIELTVMDTKMVCISFSMILAAIHFMNHDGLCQIIRAIFIIYICLNYVNTHIYIFWIC